MARTFVSSNPDYITYGDNHDIGTSDWTLAVLINTTTTTSQTWLTKGDGGPMDGYYFYPISTGKSRILFGNGSSQVLVTGSATINDGAWHLCIARLDRDGNATLWTDGASEGAGSSIAALSGDIQTTYNLTVGAAGGGGSNYDGSMAWAAMWNRLLDDAECAELNVTRNAMFISRGRIFCAHLLGSNVNDMHGLTGSVTGTPSVSDHPRMWMPSSSWVGTPAAAAAGGNTGARNFLLLGCG